MTRVLDSLLYQVSATDPLTFAGVVLFLIFVALAASYFLPACFGCHRLPRLFVAAGAEPVATTHERQAE